MKKIKLNYKYRKEYNKNYKNSKLAQIMKFKKIR